jgi:hypothetical protein
VNRRWHRTLGFFVIGLVIAVAGCSQAPSQASATPSGSGNALPDREHRAAQALLDRWADAVAKVGGPPWFAMNPEFQTGLVGTWESVEIGDNGKIALYAGAVLADPTLSDSVPPNGTVRWADGVSRPVPLMSAAAALAQIQTSGNKQCGTCHPLVVTAAKLSRVDVPTSRGQASVPAWEFTLQGTSVRITHVAVSPSAAPNLQPVPGPSRHVESATGSRDSRTLTVVVIGSPGPGNQPCGADYDGEAVESSLGVVVIVREHHTVTAPPNTACTAVGAMRQVQVELAAPLGDRAVLDPNSGTPVTVTLSD